MQTIVHHSRYSSLEKFLEPNNSVAVRGFVVRIISKSLKFGDVAEGCEDGGFGKPGRLFEVDLIVVTQSQIGGV